MADMQSLPAQNQRLPLQPRAIVPSATFLRRFQDHAPNSSQIFGFFTLVISAGILLFLTGLTLTASILGLIFFTPLILISSPLWIPIGTVLFIAIAGFLSVCAFAIAAILSVSWLYRYYRGFHPPGSDRFDYARSRIVDTANHVKDYAGGYLQGKVKDAAPGA
ncbi:oleosin 16 kDa [Ipomoea triloba]|uniref:oleosin 16 kDa n=1 Tax=Ipomoea triloba TaxID=35885 RepID=UPI00125CDD8A|nr:oleosin 16 kDa [Ipomoea triloba]GLL22032.1 oleosin 1-like [Ipomoea trifida]GMC69437.1 oleosin 1-like [Ipomoea batatas]GME15475.1 oleosin 1-like [Ipomoea batatas]